MKKKTMILGFSFVAAFALDSCDNRVTETLAGAGENQTELLKVIGHYTNSGDTLKLEAAMFLVENMKEHYYMESAAIDSFMKKVRRLETKVEGDSLSKIWSTVKQCDEPKVRRDAKTVSYHLLVDNIDKAVACWQQSPWRKEVDFKTFCRYILPHRTLHEQLASGWRDTLYNEYHPLIEGVKDMKQAFYIVHKAVSERFKRTPYDMSYLVDVLKLRDIGRGSCVQHCVYETAVMRSLALPATIDGLDAWANYSKNGHFWVALVTDNGTYTVAKNDSMARCKNYIDASVFEMKNELESDYEYPTDFKKRCFKVVRNTYEYNKNDYDDSEADKRTVHQFAYAWNLDVTKDYLPCFDVKIESSQQAEYAYLCTFRTGRGWVPAVYTKQNNGCFKFENMGDSVVYLPVYSKDGEMLPLSNPFILNKGNKQYLSPQQNTKRTMTLDRKYPLTAHFINYWPPLKGARFEASNSSDFKNATLLHTIQRTPLLKNEVSIDGSKQYRYIRYVSPEGKNPGISELTFSYKGKQIKGAPFGDETLNNKRYAFDGNYLTQTEAHVPFTFGVDFGKSVNIDKMVFSPKNDANLIIPGNKYELFYYDMGWKSLGIKTAKDFSVTYSGVPLGAIYILRNRTAGDEERIFTIENGKQIWW